MKKLIILLLILSSCSPTKLYERAVKKGLTPEKETIEVERLELVYVADSITNEIIRVDTLKIKETKTIFQDRPLTRQERLAIEREYKSKERALRIELSKDEAKYVNSVKLAKKALKMEKEKTKRFKKEMHTLVKSHKVQEKGFPWRLIFIVLVAGVLIGVFRKQIWQLVSKFILKV